MKYYIDPKKCEKHNIPIDVFLYLLALYFNSEINKDTFQKACYMGSVEYSGFDKLSNPQNLQLTSKGIEIIEDIILDTEFGDDEQRFLQLAEQLIELFPKGRKEGTNYMWRDSKVLIAKRLKTIIKKYSISFTDEEAIDATKRYVESFNGDYTYMQLLKYFLIKKSLVTGEENSQFLSYLENKENTENINTDRDNGELI